MIINHFEIFWILNFLNDCYSDQALWLQVNDYNHKENFIWFVKHYNEKGENLTSCNCSFVLILAVHNGEVNWDKWQAPSINNLNKKFEQKCKEKFVCFANKTRKTFFQICEILPIFQHKSIHSCVKKWFVSTQWFCLFLMFYVFVYLFCFDR